MIGKAVKKHWKLLVIISLLILLLLANIISTIQHRISTSNKVDSQEKLTTVTPIMYGPNEPQYIGNPKLILVQDKIETTVEEDEYFNLLKNRISEEKLSAKAWFQNKCSMFRMGKGDKFYFIERRGYHADGCPGDPMFSPRYDTFQIDLETKDIFYDDYVLQKTITFSEWAKTIGKE